MQRFESGNTANIVRFRFESAIIRISSLKQVVYSLGRSVATTASSCGSSTRRTTPKKCRQQFSKVVAMPEQAGECTDDTQRTIIDTLLSHGRAGMAEIALAAEVDLSDAETTAALGTLEAAGIVEQVGDGTPQWRVVEDKEVAEL
jgi:hypothetical protein